VTLKFSSRTMAPESKGKYKLSRRISCFNQISYTAPIFSHWRYFLNFHSTDFIFLQDYQSQRLFLRDFTLHINIHWTANPQYKWEIFLLTCWPLQFNK
jgi:hypothetical protein